ncbi:uncharacterized protein LOC122278691 [Carya illinoinensis]|uniref:uncharacterized protein LOC122278691 n=1 Tax=Carya illinoinensis TaxID=32201 RepID=UPI001C71ABAC|nr:uncharacterized protein LOC122278691 [Carya illinoinensis]
MEMETLGQGVEMLNILLNLHKIKRGKTGFRGWKINKFTWYNQHEDESFTKERLDRALVNPRWKATYTEDSVETLPAICSDHSPILLSCSFERCSAYKYHSSFKYEANWINEMGYREVVSEAWQGSYKGETGLEKVLYKLDRTRKGLQKWSRHMVRDRNRAIREKTQLLGELQSREEPSTIKKQRSLQQDLKFLLEQEDIRWRQRAKRH